METYFVKIKKPKGGIEEIKRKGNSEIEIKLLIQKEFPEYEILSIRMLLLD